MTVAASKAELLDYDDVVARYDPVLGLEVHVKDASHGGWTFYFIPKDAPSGKPFARTANCYSCHEKNAAVDTTFVQYYPTLIDAAKKYGTYKKTAE